MRYIMKPLVVAALALTFMATAVTDAEAGRRHRGAGKFIAGLATGIIAGAIISHATRPHSGGGHVYYQSSYDEPTCYRAEPVCRVRWNCWVNRWGREVCERVERCRRPVVCE